MAKFVSILIPAFNAGRYIRDCLESIASQTFTDFEVIVSNDGSTDDTLKKIAAFKASHPDLDIKIISNLNGGVSLARKRALECAKGQWVTFVDSDDTLPPTALENLANHAGDDTDLVVGFVTPPQCRNSFQNINTPLQWQYAIIQGLIPSTVWGKLYRRTLLTPEILDIPREITNGEDALTNIAYAFEMAKPPKFTYKLIYNYTRNPISLSHSTKHNLDYEYFYDTLRSNIIPQNLYDKFLLPITKDRINGVLSCCRLEAQKVAAKTHPFFAEIRKGIKKTGYKPSVFEWIVLNIKSPFIIKYTGLIRSALISMKYRTFLIFKL